MRISDWSSDVCSSDLPCVEQDEVGGARIGAGGLYVGAGLDGNGLPDGNAEAPAYGRRAFGRLPAVKLERGDRKSVVWGTSVSGRVDLGGRRIIKTQQSNSTHQSTTTVTSR